MSPIVAGRLKTNIIAAIVVPIVCPICLVVSSIPEAKPLFSGRVFITNALYGDMNNPVPIEAGTSNIGIHHTGTTAAKIPSNPTPIATNIRETGPSHLGLYLS